LGKANGKRKARKASTKHSNTSLLKQAADQGESDELGHEETLSMPIQPHKRKKAGQRLAKKDTEEKKQLHS
jgi:hypothetical protein